MIGLNIWVCLLFTLLLEAVEAGTHLREDLMIFVSLLHSLPTLLFLFILHVHFDKAAMPILKISPKHAQHSEYVLSTPYTLFSKV